MAALVCRPIVALRTSTILSVVLLVAGLVGWFALPADIRALFTGLQVATLVFFVLFTIGVMLAIGLSYVRADDRGLTVRNGLRTHRLAWSDLHGFRLGDGDPWAYVLVGDDEKVALLGIQRADGDRAEKFASELRRRWDAAG